MTTSKFLKRASEARIDEMEDWINEYNRDYPEDAEYTLARESGHWTMTNENGSIAFIYCTSCFALMLESADEFDQCPNCWTPWS